MFFCLQKRLYVDFTLVDNARVHLQASSQEESYINASYVDVSTKMPSYKIFLVIYIFCLFINWTQKIASTKFKNSQSIIQKNSNITWIHKSKKI